MRSRVQNASRKLFGKPGEILLSRQFKIEPHQVPHVLKFANIKLNEKDRATIFNKYVGKTRKYEARGMRNALSHEPTTKDLAELASRKQDYTDAMRRFVDAITDEA